MTKKEINFTQIKSFEQKVEDLNRPEIKNIIEGSNELAKPIDRATLEEQQAKKKYRLVKVQKGVGTEIDEDLHIEFRIAVIREGKTMDEVLKELISDYVRKINKKYEK